MKNCNVAMEAYLGLDKGERVPFWITWHLLTCKKCRIQVRLLRRAENAAMQTASQEVGINDASIAAVLNRISVAEKSTKNPISFSKWIIGGILILVLFVAFAFFIGKSTSRIIRVCTYIEFAALITAYCSLFVRSNMDFFVKKIHTKKN